jgi:transcriptional regulator with XRE-family HTH domain
MITRKLIALKSSRNLTNQQISDLSEVPLSTVTRILSGQTENPNIQTIADIVGALDGSMDEILGLKSTAQKEPESHTELIELYKEIIRNKDEVILSKDKAIKIMGGVLIGIVAVLLILLIMDMLNGGLGIVRY